MDSRRFFIVAVFLSLAAGAGAEPAMKSFRWLEMTPIEKEALEDDSGKLHARPTWYTPYNTSRPKIPRRSQVIGDRMEYLADDPVGQFLVYFIGQDHLVAGAKLVLELVRGEQEDGARIAAHVLSPVPTPKVAFLLETARLEAGTYCMTARLKGVARARRIPGFVFKKSAESRKLVPFPPDGVKLLVHDQAHAPDGVWPITTGVPLPRQAADSADRFALLENGQPVPAQFIARSTWYPDQQVQWLGLDFLAKYDAGKSRDYRLVRLPGGDRVQPMATPLKLSETPEAFLIDTGVIRFQVGRRSFAGIEDVRLVRPDGSSGPALVSGPGGPFLVDERHVLYLASWDENAKVTVEEAGPVRATISAIGWYRSEHDEKCCIFQTRLSAYAGLPWIHFNHRTIVTYDTDRKRLRALGFLVKPVDARRWALGADGQVISGEMPQPGKDARGQPLPADTVWLHQDRWDRFRLMRGASVFPIPAPQPPPQPIAAGKKSDGWLTLGLSTGDSVSLLTRSLWQLFPKEIEAGPDLLAFHVWPRHGHTAFTEEEELERRNLHKLYYAHQGEYLDLRLPQKYFNVLQGYGTIIENQELNGVTGNGQGLAASNDFCLCFQPAPTPSGEGGDAGSAIVPLARLYVQNLHAIADPIWNGLTEVEGRFAGRNAERFPELERILDEGYRGFMMSVDVLEDYGMWIWPDTHNNWNPVTKESQLHRWWALSHYQSVWESTFLYLRSGLPWLHHWSYEYNRHFADVGTVNYDDPSDPVLGKITGAAYHCKGFTPWGSPRQWERCHDDYVEVGAHFINPDAYLLSFLLRGDHRGLELAKAWVQAFGRVALPPERSRECNATLGEMVRYYTATWDPQAILYIRDLADDHNSRPWTEIPAHPGHTLYHDRWVQRYWELSRDPLLRQRVLEWFKPGDLAGAGKYGYPQLRALAWEWTGDRAYLTEYLQSAVGLWRAVYDNRDDPLHGYGGRIYFFPTHSHGQMLPYYMQALIDAGIDLPPPDSAFAAAVPIGRAHQPEKEKASDWFVPPAGRTSAEVGYLQPVGGQGVVQLEMLSTTDFRYAQYAIVRANPSAFRIEDAGGRVLLETTVLASSLRPKASVTLDAAQSKSPWKVYRYGDGELRWTGTAEKVTFAPTAEEALKAGP
ncbi:MAG: hypothetical protein HYU36_04395 [Planctomycetes bacterium]|nr:hypothetical protein [Planctomycetota bacterium]